MLIEWDDRIYLAKELHDPFALWEQFNIVGGVRVDLEHCLPVRWHKSIWEYVASLVCPVSSGRFFDRAFIASSGSKDGERRGAISGPMVYLADPLASGVGSLLEIRSGVLSSWRRYQRVFRRDPGGWVWVGVRREDRSGWDKSTDRPAFQNFFPWCVVERETSPEERLQVAFQALCDYAIARPGVGEILSESISMYLCPGADKEHRESARQYAHTNHFPDTVCVAVALAYLEDRFVFGVLAHELGHILAIQTGDGGGEDQADSACSRWLDLQILYTQDTRSLQFLSDMDLAKLKA